MGHKLVKPVIFLSFSNRRLLLAFWQVLIASDCFGNGNGGKMLAYKLVESGIVFYGYYATFHIKIVKITYLLI